MLLIQYLHTDQYICYYYNIYVLIYIYTFDKISIY